MSEENKFLDSDTSDNRYTGVRAVKGTTERSALRHSMRMLLVTHATESEYRGFYSVARWRQQSAIKQ